MNNTSNKDLNEQLRTVGSYVPFLCSELTTVNDIWKNKSVKISFGVEIYTNSDDLYTQLQQYANSSEGKQVETKYRLYYSVDVPVPFNLKNGFEAQIMKFQKRADMAVNSDLTLFAVAGPNKFGSVISMAYGIRALHAIDDHQLGLHAAGVIDFQKKVTHILAGDSGIGKTSLALRLEQEFPERFSVFCDDWLEVCLKSETVYGISKLFGASNDSYLDQKMKTKYEKRFTSFNKNFYFSDAILKTNIHNKLGNVFNIKKKYVREMDEFYFRSINHHIPFLNQTSGDIMTIVSGEVAVLVNKKINTILNNYQTLSLASNSVSILGNHEENYLQLTNNLLK